MEIRDETTEEAVAACEVLRQSIAQLCEADHRNDPTIMKRWLSNKKPASVALGVAALQFAAGRGRRRRLTVGSVTDAGEITLNYVAPSARFRGISRAMLKALEARALERGNTGCTLFSTETAHRFYQSAGYIDAGPPSEKFGTNSGYPMFKRLT